jgi:Alkylmercury lyase
MSNEGPAPNESLIHHLLVRGLLDNGRTPTNAELAAHAKLSATEVERALRSLDATHGLVLHPHRCEPWIVHPFSTSPTHTWVASAQRGWWAPCLWCGLGISALSGTETVIHTRIGAEAEPLEIRARAGVPLDTDLWIHLPEPPRLAWGNVHHFCARLVAFHQPGDAAAWADRHGFTPGQVLPITLLGDLARRWYGRHADRDWTKWTISEARQILADVGLQGPFWDLPTAEGKF